MLVIMEKYVDLSHTIEEDMSVFKSLPGPKISTIFTHEESKKFYKKCAFEVTKVEFQTSLGTYLDSPYHRYPNMEDISHIKLNQTILNGILVNVSYKGKSEPILVKDIPHADFKNKAALFYTGWDRYWKKDKYHDSPYLSKEAVIYLIEKGIKLVGIDAINIDNMEDEERPAHTLFLKNHILIVENLCNLRELIGKEFTFYACPLKVKKAAAFPVRAFARIE